MEFLKLLVASPKLDGKEHGEFMNRIEKH